MIDINELRKLAQAAITELLDRLEAAEKERDDVAQQLVQAEIGKRKLDAECDKLRAKLEETELDRATFIREIGDLCAKVEALREELSKQQSLSQASQQLAEVAQRRADKLSAKIEEMEQQEPVAWAATDETGRVVEALGFNKSKRFDTPLCFAASAKGE